MNESLLHGKKRERVGDRRKRKRDREQDGNDGLGLVSTADLSTISRSKMNEAKERRIVSHLFFLDCKQNVSLSPSF